MNDGGSERGMQDEKIRGLHSAFPRIAVCVATRGRPATLREALAELSRQTVRPDRVVVCHVSDDDVDRVPREGVEFVISEAGLPRQRNRLIEAVQDCDVLLFLDDDFLAAPGYVAATLAAFDSDPSIVVTTGMPIADGVKGPGLSVAEARSLIGRDVGGRDPKSATDIADEPHGYGCNMAIRLSAARHHGVLFDERLPLYGWSEDVDYTHRLGRHGRIVKLARARGVHLGEKRGRSPGRNLGYSQVANPVYLREKGSYTWGRAWRSVGRNCAANLAKAMWPEPWIDRRGRLAGNLLAFRDMLRGRMSPERVLEL